jgi:uncharacterized protein YegP (UPF0339 family)
MAAKFEIKKGKNGKFHFNLKSGNGQVILSSQMYGTRSSAENGINSVKKNSQNEALFERREGKNGKPYFIIKSGNGQEIGRSQMYSSKAGLENGINSVKTNAPTAEIVDTKTA